MDMKLDTRMDKLAEGVWAIDQGMVRCFLIVGTERALLLDTGAGPRDLMGYVRSATDMPVTLVQSHGDGDHTANSALFSEIFAHPAEHDVILRFRPGLAGRLRPTGEGDVFELGGRSLEVVEAPGHTPGSICLLDRENCVLYSGDTVSYGPVFLFGAHRDIRTYRRTLDKLWALEGYETVYPCHNTCPVGRDIIPELMAAVDGTLAGTIPGRPVEGPPLPDGAAPLCYAAGRCGILYI